ncbi:MAG: hypothetical protein ACRDYF_04900, partial [Acidimicrobiia bacterium]
MSKAVDVGTRAQKSTARRDPSTPAGRSGAALSVVSGAGSGATPSTAVSGAAGVVAAAVSV